MRVLYCFHLCSSEGGAHYLMCGTLELADHN